MRKALTAATVFAGLAFSSCAAPVADQAAAIAAAKTICVKDVPPGAGPVTWSATDSDDNTARYPGNWDVVGKFAHTPTHVGNMPVGGVGVLIPEKRTAPTRCILEVVE